MDNVLIAFEVLHALRHNKSSKFGLFSFKADTSKAYDRVDLNFLDCVMAKMWFCEKWCGWVRECLRSICYPFIVNFSKVCPW